MVWYSKDCRAISLSDNSSIEIFKIPQRISRTSSFKTYWKLHPKKHGQVKKPFSGELIDVARWQKSYLRDYKFSGVVHKGHKLPAEFEPFLKWMNETKYAIKHEFNEVLVNWYEDGSHYIGSHSDDEGGLHSRSDIVTISLGEKRKFRIRDKKTKKIVLDIELDNRTVVVMRGDTQKEFKHEIVKVNGKKGSQLGPRISITMRQFKE